jgi:hypothetical protein
MEQEIERERSSFSRRAGGRAVISEKQKQRCQLVYK